MRNLTKNLILSFSLLIIILISFVFGFYIGENYGIFEGIARISPSIEGMDFSLFWETYHLLRENFIEPEKLDSQKLIYGAVSGMVESLDDPYTVFFPPEESKRFLDDISGEFEGVGMEIGIKKSQLEVIAPLEGTPAQKAGLRPGDKILKIEDVYTRDITIEEAVDLIRGPKGTEVTLTVFRESWEKSEEIKISRDVIEVPSLKWELKDVPEGYPIAYLRLYHFSEKAKLDFKKAAVEILNSPAQKIILDVRSNPGGYLEIVQDIAGWFLKDGEIVAIEDFGGEKEKKEYLAEGNEKLLHYPLVVLINKGSASGSEILAAALRDNRDVKIIGEKSFGKGSVQELKKLRDDSGLKITIAKWLTAKGELINDVGLEPDIEVEMTEEDYREDRDPQLDRAIEIIRGL